MNEMRLLDSAVKLAERVNELEQLLEATLKSHTEEQEMAIKAEDRVMELEDLVSEISGYLDPKVTGQINTVNTGSILHQKMWEALAGKEKV